MATYILNKYQAIKFDLPSNTYNVIIRVTNPSEQLPALETTNIYKEKMVLRFYDLVEDHNGLPVFNENLAIKIVKFFKQHEYCSNMVIHCDYGISRSAAIAVGWLMFKDDRAGIYKIYHDKKHIPNRLIVELLAKQLNYNLKSINKWERKKLETFKQN